MSNPSQLFLLADHVKLSLLERQRAISLDLEPNTQDGEISRSLEALREGIEAIEAEHTRLEDANDSAAADLKDQATNLRLQFRGLSSQFYGEEASNAPSIPNNPALAPDFANASRKAPPLKHPVPQHPVSKSVRFTDTASGEDDFDPHRAALLQPYRDSPSPPRFDSSNLGNQQIHDHHVQIMREQDDQLDQLGESIGRQHQLSIQIGNELDGHIALFDEVDGDIERHATRLEGARRRLNKIRKKVGDHCSLMTIIGLIIILVILIVILK
jgi:syntaxin 8